MEKTKLDGTKDRNELEVISKQDTEKTESILNKIETFLKDNKDVSDKDVSERNSLYGEAKDLWNDLSSHINNIGFNFNINEDEYRLLKNYIFNKCNYDLQSVFMGVQLKGDFFKRADNHIINGEAIKATCNETILIHHLFENGGFTVKGLEQKAFNFRNIMTTIGDINKCFNELDIASKRAGEEINDWVHGLEETEETVEDSKTV